MNSWLVIAQQEWFRWSQERLPTQGKTRIIVAALVMLVTTTGLVAAFMGLRASVPPSTPVLLDPAQALPPTTPLATGHDQTDARSSAEAREDPTVATTVHGGAGTGPVTSGAMPVAVSSSFRVRHLHGLGNCRGRLLVSPEGVAYVPDDRTADHAFTLPHADFLYAHEGGTVAIKSATRTYRLPAAGGNDGKARRPRTADIGAAITGARAGS